MPEPVQPAAPPVVQVLANAGPGVGLGHVMRCLALARALRDQGASVTFRVPTPDAARPHLEPHGFAPAPWEPPPEGHLVVLDGYRLDPAFVAAVREAAERLLWFDDLQDPPPKADWILNAAPGAGVDAYPEAPAERLLLGPRFACLRPEFAAAVAAAPSRGRRGLFLAGGAARPEVMGALANAGAALVAADVLEGVDLVTAGAAGALARPGVTPVDFLAEPWGAMATAAVVVSAGGQSLLEAACTGAPLVGYQLTPDQVHNLEGLAAAGGVVLAGDANTPGLPERLEAAVRAAIATPELGPAAQAAIDGRGAARVAAALLEAPGAPAEARLRPAAPGDRDLLRRWRNDPAVVEHSLTRRPVTRQEHEAWYARRLARADPGLWVATTDAGLPVGQVRLDAASEATGATTAEVTIAVAPTRRGQGWGRAILSAVRARARARGVAPLSARVRADNPASLRLFEGAGYLRVGEEDEVFELRLEEP